MARLTLHRSKDAALLSQSLRDERRFTRVRRGVYADASTWNRLKPWERYRVRVDAVLATWDSPVLCLESAAVFLGLPIFGEPRDIHLLDVGGKSRRYGDVVVHATRDDIGVSATASGVETTGLPETALALCRVLPPALALAVADRGARILAAETRTLDLTHLAAIDANRRGIRRVKWVDERCDPKSESAGESVSRAVIEWLGFEAPELQVPFEYEGERDRPDFFWRRLRMIGESDGYGKYNARDAEQMKAHFVREKTREDRLRRQVDGFARWDWSDTMRAMPLGDKLHNAGLVPVANRNLALLATLRSNNRSFPATARTPRPR